MGAVTFGTPGVLGRAQRRAVALAETFPLALAAETAAAAVISGVGGLAMMLPIDGAKRSNGSVLQMDLLIYNMPLALTAGALICVIAVSITAAIDSSRLAWSAVFAAAVAMLLNHVVLVRLETRSLSTLNYVDCALAGVILGCVAVAVWPRPVAVAGYLFGALSSILVADLAQPSDFGTTLPGLDFWRGSPPLWLILAALALMLISGLVYRPPQRTHSTDDSAVVPMKPVLSAVVIYTGVLGSSMLMAHHTTIGSIVIGAVVLFAATAVAALMLPGRDGLLVVAMVAFAPAGSAVFTVPRPGWSTGLVVAGVVIGLYLGRRLRNPYLALAGSLLLAVSAIATASLTDTPGAAVTVPGCL
ncbi:MAG: hypothetical protein J2P18_19815, partial [Nocardia sp.]|nr:hypothetical protein [Nocardia sp.]